MHIGVVVNMIPGAVCKALTLLFGVIYPAYASYKTIKNKHVKNYVKLMMYWTVFAIFISVEYLTDIFFEFWFPFYYDIKLLVLLWISCPFTKGSTILYKRWVHPTLMRKETDIDEFLSNVKLRTYNVLASTAKQTIKMTASIVIQHSIVGRLPIILMILQQLCNFNNENMSQNPAILTDRVIHPLQIESSDMVEKVPVQRLKRKIQYKKFGNTVSTGLENNVI